MNRLRLVDAARLGLGVMALWRPGLFLRLSSESGPGANATVRVLGGRYIIQSVAGAALDRAWVRDVDAVVDLVHAGTMLVVAVFAPSHRRPALLSAATATGFAAADLGTRRSSRSE